VTGAVGPRIVEIVEELVGGLVVDGELGFVVPVGGTVAVPGVVAGVVALVVCGLGGTLGSGLWKYCALPSDE
jgi:hypothetical protein